MHTTLTILVAEDFKPAQVLLHKFLTKNGHTVLLADNGQQAIDLYLKHQPDLVLTDINMPVLNGLDAIKEMIKEPRDLWVPIIILSASDQQKDIVDGLNAGADDYLAKPIQLEVLNAKINAMERTVALQRKILKQQKSLKALNDELELEQVLAKELADKMLHQGTLGHQRIDYWLQASGHFSGDLIAASETPEEKLFVLLIDSTGHGLTASLPILTMAKLFHSMSKKGFSLSRIVSEMNTSTRMLMPANRFIAANMFAFDFKNKTIESWCGGNPESLILNKHGDIVHTLVSQHLALGILPSEKFNAATDIWQWQEPVALVSYSDGITDAENPLSEPFGERSVIEILQATQANKRVEKVRKKVISFLGNKKSQDDISIVSVRCD